MVIRSIRALQNFQFADLIEDVPIDRILFDENEDFTYRSIAFGKTDSLGNPFQK